VPAVSARSNLLRDAAPSGLLHPPTETSQMRAKVGKSSGRPTSGRLVDLNPGHAGALQRTQLEIQGRRDAIASDIGLAIGVILARTATCTVRSGRP